MRILHGEEIKAVSGAGRITDAMAIFGDGIGNIIGFNINTVLHLIPGYSTLEQILYVNQIPTNLPGSLASVGRTIGTTIGSFIERMFSPKN
jgi:hypothetical protein